MQSLIIYTLWPDGCMAQAFAQFMSTDECKVLMRPLSALPQPISWMEKQRAKLQAEHKELREVIGGLEMGIALAAAAPHRFPEGAVWAEDKQTHERRLRVVEWKLEQLAEQEGRQVDD